MIYSYLIDNFFPLFSVCEFQTASAILFGVIYWWWYTSRQKFYVLWGVTVVGMILTSIYAAIAMADVTHQFSHDVEKILGYMCVVMNLCLKVAPLETLKRIIRTKNSSSMSVTMSIETFIDGLLWVWTSALEVDIEALLTALRVLTFITAIAVGLSPFPEIYHVYKQRAVGDVSIFPVVTLFGNSYLWMIYSYLIGNFFPLFSVTAFAAVTSIIFSAVYWCYMYAAFAVAGVTNQTKHQVVTVLGYMCVVMNLLLKFAPLETIKRIVRTKNASSMPVTMSVVAFVNGCLWVWTSAILDDMFVLTPNVAGAALGGIQVIVYIMYRPGKSREAQPRASGSIGDQECSISDRSKNTAFIEIRSPV
ncbi:hypothetical protein PHMEG_00022242 [Phytophthora megakarya]|uniref:Sugar transporter SWEET1 n=1 Tax=Phytophthora megakarya TaxID=4795 RepID=A0A225VJ88_9STRA|nr:hypothetical protein PHMEG_00022242 [Phytophthora megakarya]